MPKANSISIVIPALNEEGNLADTLSTVIPVISREYPDYELLIFNDGSTDQTGSIAEKIAIQNPSIKVIHHAESRGLGACYREGARIATKELYLLVHGDNEISDQTIQAILTKSKEADIVIPYILNPQARPLTRRILTRVCASLSNLLFGLDLPYYNGPCLIRTAHVRHLPIENTGFGFMTETLVRLIKMGHSYVLVGFYCRMREKGRTKVFRLRNIMSVIKGIVSFRIGLGSFIRSYQKT